MHGFLILIILPYLGETHKKYLPSQLTLKRLVVGFWRQHVLMIRMFCSFLTSTLMIMDFILFQGGGLLQNY